MTPEERDLVAELFDRLAKLESAPRDPEAERAIRDGLRQAPSALYALVQTVLVQDEALKRADAQIRELQVPAPGADDAGRSGGFLGGMRGSVLSGREARAGSVPSVTPGRAGQSAGAGAGASPWGRATVSADPDPSGSGAGAGTGAVWGRASVAPGAGPGTAGGPGVQGGPGMPGGAPYMGAEPVRPGGSFLGTMAASAAGMIGGSLLLDGIRSMMGHPHAGGTASAAFDPSAGGHPAPGGSPSGGGGTLGHDAGLDDIGRGPSGDGGGGRGAGLFGGGQNDSPQDQDVYNPHEADAAPFDSGDDGGFDSGGDGDGD